MPVDDQSQSAILAKVADTLDARARGHRREAETARRGAAALRGEPDAVEALGGAAARARLAVLAARAVGRQEPPFAPADVARFLAIGGGLLDEVPLELVRTVEGAECVRRLVEREPPLAPPDPGRLTVAEHLDDLTPEEAFVAYAEGRIASPRLMAVTGLRSIYDVMGALTQRNLQLPRRPSPVGPGRDDRDLLWEHMGGREDPALVQTVPRYPRPSPLPSPELDAAWPTAMPDDAATREALSTVTAALDAVAAERESEAARAAAAAAGLRGNAAAVGGEAARARLVTWAETVVGWGKTQGENDDLQAFGAAVFILQPLLEPRPPFAVIAGGDGALELARTEEGAAMVDRWFADGEAVSKPDPVRVVAATDLDDLTPDEAYAAYADGRIDSRRLMALVGYGEGDFGQIWGELYMRGLKLPVVPTYVGPGRDDRDLLWETFGGRAEDGPQQPVIDAGASGSAEAPHVMSNGYVGVSP